jgi:drug/metabolite transporter (DMT)-like permease
VVVYVSWGTTYLATSIAMKEEHMPPALFGGSRICLAGVLLLSCQACRGQSLRLTWREGGSLLLIGAFLFLSANLLINVGQQEVSSGVAAILVATTPLWMGLFGMLWPSGERLSVRGWLGLMLGFAGIAVTMAGHLHGALALLDDYRHLFILASAASWAMGSLISRHLKLNIPHLTSAGWQMLFGGLCQMSAGIALGEWHSLPDPITRRVVVAFVYLLIFGSLSGFVAFNWLLGHVPAIRVGTYAYVNPVIAVLVGWCAGETALEMSLLAGIALVLAGIYLVRADHRPSQEIELEPD